MTITYKAIQGQWGDIFIIKQGRRLKKYGTFHSIDDARNKCNELNRVEDELRKLQEK